MDVAKLIRELLDEQRADNVDPRGPTVTGEGPTVEIVIVPHRDLGGVSLVAWKASGWTELLWAQVGDLTYHDDLDLGTVVARISNDDDWRSRFREVFLEELDRPITLRSRRGLLGRWRVDCSILVDGEARRIGVVRPDGARLASQVESFTSLSGGSRPTFSVPPSIGRPS